MSVILLPNNVYPDAAQLAVTDTSNVATTDTAGLENVTGGPRSLAWSSSDTGARRIALVNKSGGLSCSHIVAARMDQHAAKSVSVLSWSSYPGSSTTEFSTASFGETLLGRRGQDWVLPLELSGKQGIGLSLNGTDYVKHVYKLYVSDGLTFDHVTPPSYRILPRYSLHQFRRQVYPVDVEWNFVFEEVSRAELDAFKAIPDLLAEPLFLFDADGYTIRHKLIHGIIAEYQATNVFNDIFTLSLTVLELRSWV